MPVVTGVRPALAGVLLAAGLLSAGCGQDYCETVGEHQVALSDAVADSGPAALIGVLPELRDLQDHAPDDIGDEWQQVVGRVEALESALADADVDPSTYDPSDPPEGLSDGERSRIDAAAAQLLSPDTLTALAQVQQQALDVCHTPLNR